MFKALILEARSALRKKKAEIEERPEVGVGNPVSFPKRGYDGLKQLGDPRAARSTVKSGGTRGNS